MGATLRVSRQQSILDRFRKWDLVLDGYVIGSITNGRSCEVPILYGDHEVRVGHRWLSSPVRRFTVDKEDVIAFVCRPRPHPMIWVPYGVASLFRQGLFIVLEPLLTVGVTQTSHSRTDASAPDSPLAQAVAQCPEENGWWYGLRQKGAHLGAVASLHLVNGNGRECRDHDGDRTLGHRVEDAGAVKPRHEEIEQ